jgi:hypothetical protein
MSQKFIDSKLNVPCTGIFHLTVLDDGSWSIALDSVDGVEYYTTSSMYDEYGSVLINPIEEVHLTLPKWMLSACLDRISQMRLTLENNGIFYSNSSWV